MKRSIKTQDVSLDDYALRLRKWTEAERSTVLELREKNGWGPKKLSQETGIPEGQIKFWIYGDRAKTKKKRAPSQNHAKNALRKYYRDKYNDWFTWKATTLVSGFRQRLRKNKQEIPKDFMKPKEMVQWLIEAPKVCAYCSVPLTEKNLSIDHAIPISRGGGSGFDNLVTACKHCNLSKGALTNEEFMSLLELIKDWSDQGKSLLARLKRGFIGRK